MANASNPSVVRTKSVSADTTLTESDVRAYGHIVVDTSSAAVALTLPSPTRSILGYELYVSNDDDGSNDVTVTCTNGFLQDDDSFAVIPGQTAHVQVGRDASEDFRWLFFKSSSEAISDVVGSMVTGNTETGISVSYQDADNTLDFVVDSEWILDQVGAAIDTGGSGTQTGITVTYQDSTDDVDFEVLYGTEADTACEGNDSRLPTEWDDYTPTIVWDDAAPASVTTVARYMQTGPSSVRVHVYSTSADGDGKTPVSITLPAITGKQVADIDALIAVNAVEYIDTVAAGGADLFAAWLDQEDGTAGNRIIKLDGATAWTDTKDCWISVALEYEIEDET